MLSAGAVWLVPGLQHPVFARFSRFFGALFERFEALDYRKAYLEAARAGVAESIAGAVARVRPQFVIYTQFPSSYSYMTPDMLSELRETARVVGLGFDDEIYFEQAKHFYARCDAVITTDLEGAERLRRAGIAVHLAQLQHPDAEDGERPAAEDIAVSFVGDMSKPGRRAYVDALLAAGIPVRDYGAGSRYGRLPDAGVVDIFRRSRVNLNFTRTNPPRWIVRHHPERAFAGQIKARPFELAKLGRFCLCEWAPCVERWFQPEVEIGTFHDAAELVAQARRFLDDDALRQRIAHAAHARYQASYAPPVQFERMFSDILAAGPRPLPTPPWPREPLFVESIGRSKAVAFLHALRGGQPVRALSESLPSASCGGIAYWRGFVGGVKDTVLTQLHRS